jgi:hypothetical protein
MFYLVSAAVSAVCWKIGCQLAMDQSPNLAAMTVVIGLYLAVFWGMERVQHPQAWVAVPIAAVAIWLIVLGFDERMAVAVEWGGPIRTEFYVPWEFRYAERIRLGIMLGLGAVPVALMLLREQLQQLGRTLTGK